MNTGDTRLGLQCQTPVQVKLLPLSLYKVSSSEALFPPSKIVFIDVPLGFEKMFGLEKNLGCVIVVLVLVTWPIQTPNPLNTAKSP